MPNADEYKKSVQLKFRYCLGVSFIYTHISEEIAFEIGQVHAFQTSVTLTLDRVTWHTVMHHSSTSTYTPNFVQIEKMSVDGQRNGH